MRLGVIIPTYNEEEYISKCLKSLLFQTIKPVQIIICDSESSDNTLHIASEMLEHYKIGFKIVRSPRERILGKWNISAAYWKASKFLFRDLDLVACLEADTFLDRKYYETIVQKFVENTHLGLACGTMRPFGFKKDTFPLPKSFEEEICWGSNRVYRLSCWFDLNSAIDLRLVPNWEDSHNIIAIFRKWEVRHVKEAISWETRRPHSDRGLFKGLADRTYGYPGWWVLYKSIKTLDLQRLVGYSCMAIWGAPSFPLKNLYKQAIISKLRR